MGEDQVTWWLCERQGGIVPQNTDQKRVDLGLFLLNNRQIDQTILLKILKRETVLDEGGFRVDETDPQRRIDYSLLRLVFFCLEDRQVFRGQTKSQDAERKYANR
jgi:hypothetical protein